MQVLCPEISFNGNQIHLATGCVKESTGRDLAEFRYQNGPKTRLISSYQSELPSNCACAKVLTVILCSSMRRTSRFDLIRKQKTAQNAALVVLLILGGLAIAGPSGLLAWSENLRLLDQREAQLAALQKERAALENKVALLHPDRADPDMVGELLRSQLNVVHPDEVVIKLDD